MDVDLSCIICGEMLKSPKRLPCSHSCCRVCLHNYSLNHADTMFLCPKCGTSLPLPDPDKPLFQWVDSLPGDIEAAKKMDDAQWLYGATAKEKCAICLQIHKALTATKYCKTCNAYFCDECGNNHWLSLASKPHRVMLIEDLENLNNDPLLRANMAAVFSARIKCARTKSPRNGQRSPSLRSHSPIQDRLSTGDGLLTPGNVLPRNSSSPRHRNESQSINLLSPPSPRMTFSTDVDRDDCKIIAVTFLNNGCVVLSDEVNQKLKIFDKNYRFLSSIDGFCWNLVNLNKFSFVGTCPQEKCLKYFKVYDGVIKEDKMVKLNQPCYGLCKFGNTQAVACSESKVTVKIISNEKEIKSFDLDKGKLDLSTPAHLCYRNADGRNLFYVSDSETKCLKCFTEVGDIVWERTLNNMKGLAIYGTSILVGRGNQHTVDILSTEGRCLKSVIGIEEDLSLVTAIAVEAPVSSEETGDRLIVTDESELVRVFTLLDPGADDALVGHTSELPDSEIKPRARKSRLCNIL